MADSGTTVIGGVSTPAASAAEAQSHGAGTPPEGPPPRVRAGAANAFAIGPRLTAAASAARYERRPGDPVYRPLKIYTIDPSGRRLEGQVAEINIPYEMLLPGPIGSRFEVLRNPKGPLGRYHVVDLNEPRLLISNGHDPAPTDPIFHHQMVYAVAMTTMSVFRAALGREPSWGFKKQRLTIIPHADEEANARYTRKHGTLRFGWFRVKPDQAGDLPPNGRVFACLSHDIIAHELTHALLDGLRTRFDLATNPDVSAFHEAFADLVALFQRFSYKEVVRSNILRCSGDLAKDNDLLHLVFELALGQGLPSLRKVDLMAEHKYDSSLEEHDLGTVLVSAIIEAFLTIYARRSAPIISMATGGLKAVPPGSSMSADLLDSLAHLASRLASQILNMCVRAIDYCPPIDITFGEYLRALITADHDLVPDDPYAYREALIDAFRRRRIYPPGAPALTEDALLWKPPEKPFCANGLDFGQLRFSGDPGRAASEEELLRQASLIGRLVTKRDNLSAFGLAAAGDAGLDGDHVDKPVIESVRSVRRVGPDGQLAFDLVAEISQRRRVKGGGGYPAFDFYGGATLIFGAQGEVRLLVTKSIKNKERLAAQRDYVVTGSAGVYALSRCRYGAAPSALVATPQPASALAPAPTA